MADLHGSSTHNRGGARTSDDRSTSEIVASLIANGQALLRTEVELAKLEVSTIAREKATGVGLALAGAVLGLFILAFVGVTVAVALQLVLAEWLAWLIVTLVYTLVAGVLFGVAVRLFKRPSTPERTRSDVMTTVDWAKKQVQP